MGNDYQETIKIKTIFAEHFDEFWKTKRHLVPEDMRKSVEETIEKALACGDISKGFAKYVCLDCLGREEKVIGFSCKSRFCNRCGKKYIDNWVDKQVERMMDVGHRHTVFTVPEELRGKFYWQRDLLKDLSDKVAELIQNWYYKISKKKGYQVGIITVIHTFGRDLKFNPHVHALITEGALDNQNNWKTVKYIPYEYLRKAWQKVLLDLIKDKFGHEQKTRNLINRLYNNYKQGFYVHAESRLNNARGAAEYIGRYLGRPSIAEYRILKYDGKKVRFWYIDHKTEKRVEEELDVLDFIGKLIMHIPKKQFKMARRYGLYRRDLNKMAQKVVAINNYVRTKNPKKLVLPKRRKKTWKQRMVENFGKNPLLCPKCKTEMELWSIWHHKYGYLYNLLDEAGVKNDGLGRYNTIRETESKGHILQISMLQMCV